MKNTNVYLSEKNVSSLVKPKEGKQRGRKRTTSITNEVRVFHSKDLDELRKNDWKESEESLKSLTPRLVEINYKSMEVVS